MENTLQINDKTLLVVVIRKRMKHCYLHYRKGVVKISLPQRMSAQQASKFTDILCNKFKASVLKNPSILNNENTPTSTLEFNDGDITTPMGIDHTINIIPHDGRLSCRLQINEGNPKIIIRKSLNASNFNISQLVFKAVSKSMLKSIEKRTLVINEVHFKSDINAIRLRYKESNWGSYAHRTKTINFNTKILYLPEDVMDYVIVHELAHTKIQNHSAKFWQIVGNIMPDYKERRRYLRKNQNALIYIKNKENNMSLLL